jgi:hypothetical protein
MRTIHNPEQINGILVDVEKAALAAFKNELAFTVEWRDNGITEKQFSAMHVWIKLCVDYLNSIGAYRKSPVSGKLIPWTPQAFKDDVYKVILAALGKKSTKDQNTIEPNVIRLAISGHMATAWEKDIMLPEWPSARG